MGTTTHIMSIISEICCVCGTPFGIESRLKESLRNTHAAFYCPNGHGQSYAEKSKAEILQDEVTRLKAKQDQLNQSLIDKDKEIKKVTRRIKNGVCPCCNRTFINLGRHMKTKHPSFKETKSG